MPLTQVTGSSGATKWFRAGAHWQGNEINSLRIERSMLPIVGRRARYDVYNSQTKKYGYEYDWFDDAQAAMVEPHILFVNTETLTDLYTTSELLHPESSERNPIYTAEALEAQARILTLSQSIETKGTDTSWWIDNSASGSIRFQMPDNNIFQVVSFALDGSESFGYEDAIHLRTTPYHDLEKYDAVRYIQGGSSGGPPIGMEPIYGDSPSYSSDITFSAIIEPLEIRSFLFGKNVFLNYDSYPGGVFAMIENISDTSSVRMDAISVRAEKIVAFEDSNTIGFSPATSEEALPQSVELCRNAIELNPTVANGRHQNDAMTFNIPSTVEGSDGTAITLQIVHASQLNNHPNTHSIKVRTFAATSGIKNAVIAAINGSSDPGFHPGLVSYASGIDPEVGVPGVTAYAAVQSHLDGKISLSSDSQKLSTVANPIADGNPSGALTGGLVKNSVFIGDGSDYAMRLLEPIYVNDEVRYINPFEDRDMYNYVSPDGGIIAVMRLMDATLDEGDVPIDHIANPTGWVGDRMDTRSNIIYRGLMR